jgi:hypothetical protein
MRNRFLAHDRPAYPTEFTAFFLCFTPILLNFKDSGRCLPDALFGGVRDRTWIKYRDKRTLPVR